MYYQPTSQKYTTRESVANFAPNISNNVFQLVDNREIALKHPQLFQPSQTIQLARTIKYGDSAKLARARFRVGGGKRSKGLDFSVWKRGREAQHLIPAQVCKAFGVPKSWANHAMNGMMLPSGRRTTNHLRIKRLDKGKMHHIKGGGSHPNYNKYVFRLAHQQGWRKGKVSQIQFARLANRLRVLNRPYRTGSASGYIDDLK
ncbi:hypothetical protein [Kordia zhangzhouensis]|uniref:hypothetical protein n=1 Tax=Kordia zhangzhouensis TaxID=1620405 RepID=UPI0006296342|nr:hypothetical protein [Kordia zhangzhouensis]